MSIIFIVLIDKIIMWVVATLLSTSVCFMLQASMMIDQAEILEPFVSHLSGVFSKEDCQRIIQTAEQAGFPVILDSVDYNEGQGQVSPSWQIDIEYQGKVYEPTLSKIYQPYLPIVNRIVWEHKKTIHRRPCGTLDGLGIFEKISNGRFIKATHVQFAHRYEFVYGQYCLE
jgi:hypothetical protein